MATASPPTSADQSDELTVPVLGMTCASCVNRIERFLNRAEGVSEASVNLATERATVRYDPARIDRAAIVATIESAGYQVAPERSAASAGADEAIDKRDRETERRELLTGALVSLGIGVAMMAVMFWPGGPPWPMPDINRWFIAPATVVQ
ncbi:MAG TPA: cation transporter, partial [Candidatus Limnocylindria bacterium]|nr:cation transporter [Candidatus Limnocylindria bacterium]